MYSTKKILLKFSQKLVLNNTKKTRTIYLLK